MNLDQIFERHGSDKSTANGWHGYSRVYEPLFEPMRNKPIRLLEIGVSFGASIKSWLYYFPSASIAGVDVANDFKCDDKRYVFAQGDQGNRAFWDSFNPFLAPWTICIDDGPHTIGHQTRSFDALWPKVESGGFYIIEDVYTWPDPRWSQVDKAREFLFTMFSDLNRGGKQYYGRPNGVGSDTPTQAELSIDWIQMHPGLVILKKK